MIRRWLSVLLALAMLISVVPAQALSVGAKNATSAVQQISFQHINPQYAHLAPPEDSGKVDWTHHGNLDFGGEYLSVEEAAGKVREAMTRRETAIQVNYYTSEPDNEKAAFAAFHAALNHTENPKEGDYLANQYHNANVSGSVSGGMVDGVEVKQFSVTYSIIYFTDAAQEAEMDSAVSALLKELNVWCADDYTKFMAVYRYMCDNITYDNANLNDDTYLLKHSAYAALINKTAVCQGYAVLLYRLMLELGIDCRYISGIGNGGPHGWNIVELDGKYYNADATWDATYRQAGYDFRWCLQNQTDFADHMRNAEFDTAAFHSAYPMDTANYAYSGDGSLKHNYVDGVCSVCQDVQSVEIVVSGTCGSNGNNVKWSLDNFGVLRIFGTGAMDNYSSSYYAPWYKKRDNIQAVIIGDGVTSIGERAFYNCTSLTSITIPDNVTTIGKYAFYYCTSLTSITIPDSVTSIGSEAFYSCTKLHVYITDASAWCKISFSDSYAHPMCYGEQLHILDAEGNEVTEITLDNTVTTIPRYAFADCKNLTSITIPEGITSIGGFAFSYCSSLTSITIPESVTTIGYDAFFYCTSLTSITIPGSVTSIGSWAFQNCSSLTSITIPESVTSIAQEAFSGCTSLTSITIPNSVTSIGSHAFYKCTSLTGITIPDSVTSISGWAFYGCTSLTGVTIPDSVTSIGSSAFSGCSSLTGITIPEGVTSIGSSAFRNCSSLTSITIPESVTSIGSGAFGGCSNLESITLPFVGESRKSASDTYQYPFGYIFGTSSYDGGVSTEQYYYHSTTYTTSATYYIPSSLKSVTVTSGEILYGAFYNCSNLTSITIPNSVTSIGNYAFYYCSSLTSITIPESVTSIGAGAFYYCSSLTSITIPNSVTSIGDFAFRNCSSLTSITIPESVTSIGSGAFGGCSNLESITLPFVGGSRKSASDTYQYPFGYIFGTSSYTGGVKTEQYYYGYSTTSTTSNTYYIPSSLKSVTITGGEILRGAFYNCSNLTSITIPNSVTSIGSSAFSGCTSLTSITIPEGVTSIDSSAFFGCTGLTGITIPESVTSIGVGAFYGCTDLTSITIPEGVTSIGNYAFYNCTGLTDVYYTGTAEQWAQISIGSSNNPLRNATLHTIVCGDADGNGVVNGADVIHLKNYLAEYDYDTGVSSVEIAAGADANGDGVINGVDVIRLKNYLANYDYDTGTSTIPLGPQ